MRSNDEILDTIVGRMDAPALHRYQFFVAPAFYRWSVTMIEGKTWGASAYFWLLSRQYARELMSDDGLLIPRFDEQKAVALTEQQDQYWREWQLNRLEEANQVKPCQTRDGIWVTARFFDGANPRSVEFINPDPKWQPL